MSTTVTDPAGMPVAESAEQARLSRRQAIVALAAACRDRQLPDPDGPATIHGLATTVVDGVRVCVCHGQFWSVCPDPRKVRRAGGAR